MTLSAARGGNPPAEQRNFAMLLQLGELSTPVVIPLLAGLLSRKPFVRAVAFQAATAQLVSVVWAWFSFEGVYAAYSYAVSKGWQGLPFWSANALVVLITASVVAKLPGLTMAVLGAHAASKGLVWRVPLLGEGVALLTRTFEEPLDVEPEAVPSEELPPEEVPPGSSLPQATGDTASQNAPHDDRLPPVWPEEPTHIFAGADPSLTQSQNDRLQGMRAHEGCFLGPVVIPLVIYHTNRDRPFVRAVAIQAILAHCLSCIAVLGLVLAFAGLLYASIYDSAAYGDAMVPLFLGAVALAVLTGPILTTLGGYHAGRGRIWRVPILGSLLATLTHTRDEDVASG